MTLETTTVFGAVSTAMFAIALYWSVRTVQQIRADRELTLRMFFLKDRGKHALRLFVSGCMLYGFVIGTEILIRSIYGRSLERVRLVIGLYLFATYVGFQYVAYAITAQQE
jgi:hypothetical protein